MTKEEFITRQSALKSYCLKISFLWIAGFGVFILWPIIAIGKMDMHYTSPLFQACFIVYLFGGLTLFAWLQIRKQKQLGCFCSKCLKRFGANRTVKIVIDSGKCTRCGEIIIES